MMATVAKGVGGMRVAVVAVELGLKDNADLVGTIVMMVRHNGMQQDDSTCQGREYFGHYMFHNMQLIRRTKELPLGRFRLQRYTF